MKKALKTIWIVISTIMKIALLLVVILILMPIGYFAWRAGQPMSMPEYDGRTYYELLAERRQAYDELAAEYQAGHQDVEVKASMCYQNEVIVSVGYTLPWAGFCALSEMLPSLQKSIGPRAQQAGCSQNDDTSWLNILNVWWITFERMQYPLYEHRMIGPVTYCRIPTP